MPEYLFVHLLSCSILQLTFCLWACSLLVRRWRALAGHYALCYWLTAHSPCWETTSLPTACTGGVPLAENWLTGSCLSAPASTPDTRQSACGRRCWRKEWYLMVIWGQWLSFLTRQFPPSTPSWRNSPWWARSFSLSRLHNHTLSACSVGLLWTIDQPNAETSTWQHTQHLQETMPRRDSNPQSQETSGRRPTP
jgi:hypothetical protein